MILEFILSVLRLSTPLLLAAYAGMISERAGIINLALEGLMLVGAFVGAIVTLKFGSPVWGFAIAGLAGALVAIFYGLCVIWGKADQVVTGTALNLLVMGVIPLALKVLYDSTGSTPNLGVEQRFVFFPLVFSFVSIVLVYIVLQRTALGLWISFAGEKPEVLEVAGISVKRIRYIALFICGSLAAWGGACLSLWLSSGYSRNMVAGRGFMALAALIFGKWRPIPVIIGCLLFGVMDALQIRMQDMHWFPPAIIQMLPYLLTVFILAGFISSAKAPSALGR